MPPSRIPRPAWAAALALLCGCSSETTPATNRTAPPTGAPASVYLPRSYGDQLTSEESFLEQFDAAELTREEIWALGVSRFGWYPEEPPTNMTRESMAHWFDVDTNFKIYDDRLDDNYFRAFGSDE